MVTLKMTLGSAALPVVNYPLLFEESPDVLLVLLPDSPKFTMIAATHARFRATHTSRESLGHGLFEDLPRQSR